MCSIHVQSTATTLTIAAECPECRRTSCSVLINHLLVWRIAMWNVMSDVRLIRSMIKHPWVYTTR